MKNLTSWVFYTNVVLNIVILYVRLNSVLEPLCKFSSRVQEKGGSVMFFDFTPGVYFERRSILPFSHSPL